MKQRGSIEKLGKLYTMVAIQIDLDHLSTEQKMRK